MSVCMSFIQPAGYHGYGGFICCKYHSTNDIVITMTITIITSAINAVTASIIRVRVTLTLLIHFNIELAIDVMIINITYCSGGLFEYKFKTKSI